MTGAPFGGTVLDAPRASRGLAGSSLRLLGLSRHGAPPSSSCNTTENAPCIGITKRFYSTISPQITVRRQSGLPQPLLSGLPGRSRGLRAPSAVLRPGSTPMPGNHRHSPARPGRGGVLANPAGENDRVQAVHRRGHSGDGGPLRSQTGIRHQDQLAPQRRCELRPCFPDGILVVITLPSRRSAVGRGSLIVTGPSRAPMTGMCSLVAVATARWPGRVPVLLAATACSPAVCRPDPA